MKRSNAVEAIYQILEDNMDQVISIEMADSILKKLEEAGMLPPEALIPVSENPNFPELKGLKEWSHEWEPE